MQVGAGPDERLQVGHQGGRRGNRVGRVVDAPAAVGVAVRRVGAPGVAARPDGAELHRPGAAARVVQPGRDAASARAPMVRLVLADRREDAPVDSLGAGGSPIEAQVARGDVGCARARLDLLDRRRRGRGGRGRAARHGRSGRGPAARVARGEGRRGECERGERSRGDEADSAQAHARPIGCTTIRLDAIWTPRRKKVEGRSGAGVAALGKARQPVVGQRLPRRGVGDELARLPGGRPGRRRIRRAVRSPDPGRRGCGSSRSTRISSRSSLAQPSPGSHAASSSSPATIRNDPGSGQACTDDAGPRPTLAAGAVAVPGAGQRRVDLEAHAAAVAAAGEGEVGHGSDAAGGSRTPTGCLHGDLNAARLPVPPQPRASQSSVSRESGRTSGGALVPSDAVARRYRLGD